MSGFRVAGALFLALALIAGAAGLGYMVYNAGVAQGAAQAGGQLAPSTGAAMPYYAFAPYPYHPFGFLGCLVPLFFLFLVFFAFRMVFGFGRRWHGGPWGWRGGPWGSDEMRKRWSEKAEEWHRRQHGEAEQESKV
jgi:hypothetical protein